MTVRPLELTDLLDVVDASVRVEQIVERLEAGGQHRAARLARRLPAVDGQFDLPALSALLLRVHCELQRLGEELQLPRRVASVLVPWVHDLQRRRPTTAVRIVDIGCGLGYVVRWLSAHGVFDETVELVGVDSNELLVRQAAALARTEGLACRFVTGDALRPGVAVGEGSDTILISTGLLHHLSPEDLRTFFVAQQVLGVAGFAHWDVDPGPWATVGAWVFHRARMREPLSRHDGVLSARRAHRAVDLLAAARAGAPAYDLNCADAAIWRPRLSDVIRPIVGKVLA